MNPQDPLAQLRDIHLPATGSFWPPAPGWWVIGILCLLGIATALLLWRRHRRITLWKRQARDLLTELAQRAEQTPEWFAELNALLKRVARAAFPQQNPQAMSGHQWVDFLLETVPDNRVASRPVVEAMVASTWQPATTADPRQAIAFAVRWLEART